MCVYIGQNPIHPHHVTHNRNHSWITDEAQSESLFPLLLSLKVSPAGGGTAGGVEIESFIHLGPQPTHEERKRVDQLLRTPCLVETEQLNRKWLNELADSVQFN